MRRNHAKLRRWLCTDLVLDITKQLHDKPVTSSTDSATPGERASKRVRLGDVPSPPGARPATLMSQFSLQACTIEFTPARIRILQAFALKKQILLVVPEQYLSWIAIPRGVLQVLLMTGDPVYDGELGEKNHLYKTGMELPLNEQGLCALKDKKLTMDEVDEWLRVYLFHDVTSFVIEMHRSAIHSYRPTPK